MSGFIDESDRFQGMLLPERVDEYVCDENPVRIIEAFIGELDLAKLGFEGMEPKSTGRPGMPAPWRAKAKEPGSSAITCKPQ